MRWGVAARLTHRFTRKTDIWTQLTYNDQDSNGNTLGAGSDFENFLAVVGVRHVFEPIKLW
jgi:predicted porin